MIDKYLTLKKLKDPKFYLENFCKIKGKKPGQLIPFVLNEAQKDLFNTVKKNSRVIICKSRQIGFSTAMTGYFYHNTIMNPGTTTALIGYNSELTAELLDKIKTFYNSTPNDLKPTRHFNSKYEISYPRVDSKILVLASTENVGRGYTLNNVLATELSAWEKQEDKMSTLEASVPINGKLVIESTPRGQGNLYHRTWMAEDNDYAKKEYGWWWGYCLDDETEILTVDGWKKRKDFNIGEKHFTVNLKTKKLEIKVATNKIEYDFRGNMVHFKSQNLDMMVTPNHKCIVESAKHYQSTETWVLKQAKDLDKLDYIPLSTHGWSEKLTNKYSDDFVELIGWVVTEASFEKYLIYIYQNVGENLDRIEKLCKNLGYKYTKYIRPHRNCGEIRIHSSSTKYIRKILEGKCKNLPMKFLLALTHDQLIILQRTMVMADGYIPGGMKKIVELCDNKCNFVQKDECVADNFQTLATMVGNSSSKKQNKTVDKCYVVHIKSDGVAQKFSKKYEEYNGKVWCPTNDNGTIIIRRNGKVMITGQSKDEIELIRKRMNNPMKFAQEYGLEFLASGRSVFDQMIIKKQRKNILNVGDAVIDSKTGDTYFVKEEDGLRMYKKPENDGLYVMGVDVSEGVEGGDYSVAIIFDRKTGEEVAMFRGLLPPDRLAKKIDKWGRMYNNALMVVEINNHGLTTVTVLRQLIYPSLYFRQAKFETIGQGSSDKIGWKTTKLTRPLLIDEFAQAARDEILTIHSKELLNEMAVFVYNDNGDMQPQEGFFDDMIFAAGICFQGFKVLYHKKLEQLNYANELPINFAY